MDVSNRFPYNRKHEEDLKRLKNFRLLDDDFCTKVFEDIECVELLLRIILKKDDLKVTEVHSQYNMKNLQGTFLQGSIYLPLTAPAMCSTSKYSAVTTAQSQDGQDTILACALTSHCLITRKWVTLGALVPQHTCGGQRTTCGSQFSPSTMWVLGIELRL